MPMTVVEAESSAATLGRYELGCRSEYQSNPESSCRSEVPAPGPGALVGFIVEVAVGLNHRPRWSQPLQQPLDGGMETP
jgi:hypothetical protein